LPAFVFIQFFLYRSSKKRQARLSRRLEPVVGDPFCSWFPSVSGSVSGSGSIQTVYCGWSSRTETIGSADICDRCTVHIRFFVSKSHLLSFDSDSDSDTDPDYHPALQFGPTEAPPIFLLGQGGTGNSLPVLRSNKRLPPKSPLMPMKGGPCPLWLTSLSVKNLLAFGHRQTKLPVSPARLSRRLEPVVGDPFCSWFPSVSGSVSGSGSIQTVYCGWSSRTETIGSADICDRCTVHIRFFVSKSHLFFLRFRFRYRPRPRLSSGLAVRSKRSAAYFPARLSGSGSRCIEVRDPARLVCI
jgi:hypothetical protein